MGTGVVYLYQGVNVREGGTELRMEPPGKDRKREWIFRRLQLELQLQHGLITSAETQ